jgi:hypothetical protein
MKTPKLMMVMAAVAIMSGIGAVSMAASAERPTVAKLPAQPIGPLTIVYFRAEPARVQQGQSSILKWKVTGATTVTLYGEDSSVCERQFGKVAPEDSLMVCPEGTTDYILSAQGPDGETMQSVTVHVMGTSLKIHGTVHGKIPASPSKTQ